MHPTGLVKPDDPDAKVSWGVGFRRTSIGFRICMPYFGLEVESSGYFSKLGSPIRSPI